MQKQNHCFCSSCSVVPDHTPPNPLFFLLGSIARNPRFLDPAAQPITYALAFHFAFFPSQRSAQLFPPSISRLILRFDGEKFRRISFIMQLTSKRSQNESSDENLEEQLFCPEPGQSSDGARISGDHLSSCEIASLDGDEDSLNLDGVDENSKLVSVEVPQCRICLDNGGEDLIAPCYCRGTQKYVHRTCLDHWRSTKEGVAFSHCTECQASFILRANVPADRWWLRFKFRLLVIRDHALIFIIVQLLVASLGMLVYRFYGDELRDMFGYEEHPYGFYAMAVIAVVLVGLLYGFFIIIIFGQRINERHYHVLQKQELTKEYVVENRDENENAPKLDSSHIMELRMLGLY